MADHTNKQLDMTITQTGLDMTADHTNTEQITQR